MSMMKRHLEELSESTLRYEVIEDRFGQLWMIDKKGSSFDGDTWSYRVIEKKHSHGEMCMGDFIQIISLGEIV